MSRIGRRKIQTPAGVAVTITEQEVKVKGPKGELVQKLHPLVTITQKENLIEVQVRDENDKEQRALWGLFNALVQNMVLGVTAGFSKKLEIHGVGYKAVVKGTTLELELGFSHPIEFALPQGVVAQVTKNVITLEGIDKQLIGETAARIRNYKKPEPYKGKGIKYVDEHIIRKAGKQAKSSE